MLKLWLHLNPSENNGKLVTGLVNNILELYPELFEIYGGTIFVFNQSGIIV